MVQFGSSAWFNDDIVANVLARLTFIYDEGRLKFLAIG